MSRLRLFVSCVLLVVGLAVRAQEKAPEPKTAWLAENYTKFEYRIAMRDGVRLFTRVYAPKDVSQPWPILLTRTPYASKPYGADNYQDPQGSFETLARDKFILVTQDVRGRYGSEGDYLHMRPSTRTSAARATPTRPPTRGTRSTGS